VNERFVSRPVGSIAVVLSGRAFIPGRERRNADSRPVGVVPVTNDTASTDRDVADRIRRQRVRKRGRDESDAD